MLKLPFLDKLSSLNPNFKLLLLVLFIASTVALLSTLFVYSEINRKEQETLNVLLNYAAVDLKQTEEQFNEIKTTDQVQLNLKLLKENKDINENYKLAIKSYEEILKLKESNQKTEELDKLFAKVLTLLSERNYSEANKNILDLNKKIADLTPKAPATAKIPENVKVSNTPPGVGYSQQRVDVEGLGSYLVSIISADLNSTRVIVDTASGEDCSNACPTLPLGEYVSRNGAFAGVNGSYFCPEAYPSCAGKTNSFDTLLMNKNKVYFNSDNNVFSTVPAIIFSGNSGRIVGASSEWGRDTSVDTVIANHPLVMGGNVSFGGNDDPKQGSKGNRSFVGFTDSTVYIGVVHNATVAESARVLAAMGVQNALNLDSGGSTALWSGGYKVGPGRNIANAVLLVGK